jgi:hypothetical protein
MSSHDFSWAGRVFKQSKGIMPTLMEDDSALDNTIEHSDTEYRDILKKIKYEDSRTDHSMNSLTHD